MPPTAPSTYDPNPVTPTAPDAYGAFGSASLDVALSGPNNDFHVTAKTPGADGNKIAFEIAAPAAQASTGVAVSGTDITVTPGTKARMIVTGELTRNGVLPLTFPVLQYAGVSGGKARYTATGLAPTGSGFEYLLYWSSGDSRWQLEKQHNGSLQAEWRCTDSVATPDLGSTWTPVSPATGTPAVAAAVSTSLQAIVAIADLTTAAELIEAVNKFGNDGTGVLSAFSKTYLSGGSGNAAPETPEPIQLGLPNRLRISGVTVPEDLAGDYVLDTPTLYPDGISPTWTKDDNGDYSLVRDLDDGGVWKLLNLSGLPDLESIVLYAATTAEGHEWTGELPWLAPAESWELENGVEGTPRIAVLPDAPAI